MTKRAFIIGGGPSASLVDFKKLKGKGLIVAVNDSYKKLPFFDVVFTADGSWLRQRVPMLIDCEADIIAALPDHMCPPALKRLKVLRRLDGVGLRQDDSVHYADNSGLGALAHFVVKGFDEIYLVGFDLKEAGHWHGGYEWKNRIGVKQYPDWIKSFNQLAVLIKERTSTKVFNVNENSGIRCFPFVRIEDV